ncbi:MAG: helix-turn-helix domain-containing protein [Erysipelotrichaceae bacterium]|nr:helix-turn-helix domain-containing protein [Erysipelotrichaceae bacterium]
MNIKSLNNYCESIFELLSIPMIIYHSKTGKILNGYFFDNAFSDLMINNPKITNRYLGTSLFNTQHNISFYISDDNIAFGAVKDKSSDLSLYIGPCLLADPNEQMMHSMLTRSNSPFRKNPNKYYEMIYNYIKKLPRFTINRFLWLLSFTGNYLNHDAPDPETFYQASMSKNRIDIAENKLDDNVSSTFFDVEKHASVIEELKALILNGSPDSVVELWNENGMEIIYEPLKQTGWEDQLRYAKNMFLMFISDVSSSLIQHNISRVQIHNITSRLMNDVESCIIVQQIEAVYRSAIIELTELVRTVNMEGKTANVLVHKAINYIHDHINEPILSEDIAENAGISTGYLSVLFNREMKMKISDYINIQKIAVAESLLINTDAEIIDISSYLSFSSQSHFNNIFKKVTGITPLKYRRLHLEKTSR